MGPVISFTHDFNLAVLATGFFRSTSLEQGRAQPITSSDFRYVNDIELRSLRDIESIEISHCLFVCVTIISRTTIICTCNINGSNNFSWLCTTMDLFCTNLTAWAFLNYNYLKGSWPWNGLLGVTQSFFKLQLCRQPLILSCLCFKAVSIGIFIIKAKLLNSSIPKSYYLSSATKEPNTETVVTFQISPDFYKFFFTKSTWQRTRKRPV